MAMAKSTLDQLKVDLTGSSGSPTTAPDGCPTTGRISARTSAKRAEQMLGRTRPNSPKRRNCSTPTTALDPDRLPGDGRRRQGWDDRHVMSGVNPQGCSVSSFKAPSATEWSHNYLWRYSNALPARRMIGIFNRSYYEEVLVVKVHRSCSTGPPPRHADT